MSNTIASLDNETHRATITEIDDTVAYAMLDAIRDSRLRLAADYERKMRERHEARSDRVRGMYDKQLDLLKKDFVKLDALIEKATTRVHKMRAFKLELDDPE